MENKKVIGVLQVLQDLKDGLTRDDIATKYGITASECKAIFMDERLKGKKTIKKPTYILVDDATVELPVVSEEIKEEIVLIENTEEIKEETETLVKEGFGQKFLDKKEDNIPEETEEKEEETPKASWE